MAVELGRQPGFVLREVATARCVAVVAGVHLRGAGAVLGEPREQRSLPRPSQSTHRDVPRQGVQLWHLFGHAHPR